MKRLKKALRLTLLVVLIILASLGLGLTGGVPLSAMGKRQLNPEVHAKQQAGEQDTRSTRRKQQATRR